MAAPPRLESTKKRCFQLFLRWPHLLSQPRQYISSPPDGIAPVDGRPSRREVIFPKRWFKFKAQKMEKKMEQSYSS